MKTLFLLCILVAACQSPSADSKRSEMDLPLRVEPILIHQLGSEHFGNAIYRRGINGPRIAASGSRILEWPIQASAAVTEVVPSGRGNYNNGACVIDVNGDNIDEMIVARTNSDTVTALLWLEEIPGQTVWKEHLIADIEQKRGEEGIHDIMPFEARVSDSILSGVAVLVNRQKLFWYEIPDNITQPWKLHSIADLREYGSEAAQSGLVPGDLAGNGRNDLTCGNFWAECPEDPVTESWQIHRYSNWDKRSTPKFPEVPEWVSNVPFGGMNQLDLGDMDGDGRLDIVASDAEIPDSRVSIFRNDPGNLYGLWKETVVDTGLYCPHSLVVADVNTDKRPDIIVGEMTTGGWWFPRIYNPRLYLYLNLGSMKFQKYILHEGWGIHMMRMAPVLTHGSLFIFAAEEIQSWYKDMTTHIVGWTLSPERE